MSSVQGYEICGFTPPYCDSIHRALAGRRWVGHHVILQNASAVNAHPGEQPDARMVVVVDDWSREQLAYWLGQGAVGVVASTSDAKLVADAIVAASADNFLIPSKSAQELLATFSGGQVPALSAQDTRLLQLVAIGTKQVEIADSTGWSERTIRRRLAALRTRFRAESTMEVVGLALRAGLLDLDLDTVRTGTTSKSFR